MPESILSPNVCPLWWQRLKSGKVMMHRYAQWLFVLVTADMMSKGSMWWVSTAFIQTNLCWEWRELGHWLNRSTVNRGKACGQNQKQANGLRWNHWQKELGVVMRRNPQLAYLSLYRLLGRTSSSPRQALRTVQVLYMSPKLRFQPPSLIRL
jgi:hypothetical protein